MPHFSIHKNRESISEHKIVAQGSSILPTFQLARIKNRKGSRYAPSFQDYFLEAYPLVKISNIASLKSGILKLFLLPGPTKWSKPYPTNSIYILLRNAKSTNNINYLKNSNNVFSVKLSTHTLLEFLRYSMLLVDSAFPSKI